MSFKAQLQLRDQIFIVLEDLTQQDHFFCMINFVLIFSKSNCLYFNNVMICKDRQGTSTHHSEQIG